MVRDSKVYACPHTNLGKVLFNCLMFCDEEIRDLSNKIIEFSAVEFPKFCRNVKHICVLPIAC